MAWTNQYRGTCSQCGADVPPGAGWVDKQGRGRRTGTSAGERWQLWCQPCRSRATVPVSLMGGVTVTLTDSLAAGCQVWWRGDSMIGWVHPDASKGTFLGATRVDFSTLDYPGGLQQVAKAVSAAARRTVQGGPPGADPATTAANPSVSGDFEEG